MNLASERDPTREVGWLDSPIGAYQWSGWPAGGMGPQEVGQPRGVCVGGWPPPLLYHPKSMRGREGG